MEPAPDYHYDYLTKSGFTEQQAEALAVLLKQLEARFSTKDELQHVQRDMNQELRRVQRDMNQELRRVEHELRLEMKELRLEIAGVKTRVTWLIVGAVPVLAALMTLIQLYVG